VENVHELLYIAVISYITFYLDGSHPCIPRGQSHWKVGALFIHPWCIRSYS